MKRLRAGLYTIELTGKQWDIEKVYIDYGYRIDNGWRWSDSGEEFSEWIFSTKKECLESLFDYVAHREYVEGLGFCYVEK